MRADLGRIEIEAPPAVTLSSDSGPLGVTLVNGLDQPVEVRVQVRTDGELTLSGGGVRRLGPGARSVVRFEATTSRAGVHNVRLAVTSLDGVPLGSFDSLPDPGRPGERAHLDRDGPRCARAVRDDRLPPARPDQGPSRRARRRRQRARARTGARHRPRPAPTPRPTSSRRRRTGPQRGPRRWSARERPERPEGPGLVGDHGGRHRPVPRVGLRPRRAAGGRPRRPACTPTSSTSPTRCPTCSTSCWRAASSTRCWCRSWSGAMQGRPRRRRRLRQPDRSPSPRSSWASSRSCWSSPRRWLMRLYLDGRYLDPDRAAQRESIIAFARCCLPQVFFYGMYVLVGQVLNARGRFGPMMWAPIANNLHLGRRAGHLPGRLRPDRGRRGPVRGVHHQPGAAARPRLDARHRGPVPDPGALPARARASATGPASTSATPGSATPCPAGRAGRCCS